MKPNRRMDNSLPLRLISLVEFLIYYYIQKLSYHIVDPTFGQTLLFFYQHFENRIALSPLKDLFYILPQIKKFGEKIRLGRNFLFRAFFLSGLK